MTLCRLQANWRHDIQHDDTRHEHELGLSTVCQIPIICFHYYIKCEDRLRDKTTNVPQVDK
jgi:hypothetical protein